MGVPLDQSETLFDIIDSNKTGEVDAAVKLVPSLWSWSVDCLLPFVYWSCARRYLQKWNDKKQCLQRSKGVAGHFPRLRGGCEERNLLAYLFAFRRLWRRKRVRCVAFRPISTWRLGPTVRRSCKVLPKCGFDVKSPRNGQTMIVAVRNIHKQQTRFEKVGVSFFSQRVWI